jgi:hypothetical protein
MNKFTETERNLIYACMRSFIKRKKRNIESVKERFGEHVDENKVERMEEAIVIAKNIQGKCA